MTVTIIAPTARLLTPAEEIAGWAARVEYAGRVCYRSHDRSDGTAEGAAAFCRGLIGRGHESVLEHVSLSVEIVCSRTCSHQLVRHRLCSFSQESQRYVKYDDGIEIIMPDAAGTNAGRVFGSAEGLHVVYQRMRECGAPAEVARSVLPGCTATRLVMTANLRQWRHVWRLRCDPHAQAEIRGLATAVRDAVAAVAPWAVEGV